MTRPNFHLFFGIYHSVGLTAVMASLIAQASLLLCSIGTLSMISPMALCAVHSLLNSPFFSPSACDSVSPFALNRLSGLVVRSSVASGRTYPLSFWHSALQFTCIPNTAISGRLYIARDQFCPFGPFGPFLRDANQLQLVRFEPVRGVEPRRRAGTG